MNAFQKTLIVISFFFLAYFLFGFYNYFSYGLVNNTQDYYFHWGQASGISHNDVYWNELEGEHTNFGYPPFYHLVTKVFTFHPLAFYFFNVVFLTVLMPLALFRVAKNVWSVLIYFMGVSFVHMVFYSATYPLAFNLFFVILYLGFRKNYFLLIFFMILSYFTHSYFHILFAAILLWELIDQNQKFLSKVSEKLKSFPAVGWLTPETLESPGALISVFMSHTPIPVFVYGAIGAIQQDILYLFLGWGGFWVAFDDLRGICLTQLIFCITAGVIISKKSKKFKMAFLFLLLVQLSYYILDFWFGTVLFITS